MSLQNKVFVVTGAGNGIGRDVALELVRRGAKVAGVDINPQWLEETKSLAGNASEHFSAHAVNITDRDRVMALPDEVSGIHGPVDGLINVAGIIQPFVRVNDLDFESIDRVMNVNFFGVLNLIKAFLPGLLSRPEAHLVNTSSMGSYAPVPGQTLYGASKAAVNLLTEGLRSELRGTSVAVTLVFPGAIGTNIAGNSGLSMTADSQDSPKMKMVSPAEAARLIVDATEAKKKRILVGSDAKTMYRLTKLNQDFAANLIYQGMKSLLPK